MRMIAVRHLEVVALVECAQRICEDEAKKGDRDNDYDTFCRSGHGRKS